jgi:hypothetical protein
MMTARETLERHCQLVLEGKMEEVAKDLTPEVAAGLQPLVEVLGKVKPTTYKILEEKKEGEQYIFTEEYIGKDSSLKVRSTWAWIEGNWKVVKAEAL